MSDSRIFAQKRSVLPHIEGIAAPARQGALAQGPIQAGVGSAHVNAETRDGVDP